LSKPAASKFTAAEVPEFMDFRKAVAEQVDTGPNIILLCYMISRSIIQQNAMGKEVARAMLSIIKMSTAPIVFNYQMRVPSSCVYSIIFVAIISNLWFIMEYSGRGLVNQLTYCLVIHVGYTCKFYSEILF
jgi:hypothetical protein